MTAFLTENQVRVRYLHSEIDTLERTEILTAFRQDKFDVIVGINLLREGLDLPEVELVAILDADKEGLFRSTRALIQTIGRAARNDKARVILYANKITPSMQTAMDETSRRRQIQMDYNAKHGIVPRTVYSSIKNSLYITQKESGEVTHAEDEMTVEQFNLQRGAAVSEAGAADAVIVGGSQLAFPLEYVVVAVVFTIHDTDALGDTVAQEINHFSFQFHCCNFTRLIYLHHVAVLRHADREREFSALCQILNVALLAQLIENDVLCLAFFKVRSDVLRTEMRHFAHDQIHLLLKSDLREIVHAKCIGKVSRKQCLQAIGLHHKGVARLGIAVVCADRLDRDILIGIDFPLLKHVEAQTLIRKRYGRHAFNAIAEAIGNRLLRHKNIVRRRGVCPAAKIQQFEHAVQMITVSVRIEDRLDVVRVLSQFQKKINYRRARVDQINRVAHLKHRACTKMPGARNTVRGAQKRNFHIDILLSFKDNLIIS